MFSFLLALVVALIAIAATAAVVAFNVEFLLPLIGQCLAARRAQRAGLTFPIPSKLYGHSLAVPMTLVRIRPRMPAPNATKWRIGDAPGRAVAPPMPKPRPAMPVRKRIWAIGGKRYNDEYRFFETP